MFPLTWVLMAITVALACDQLSRHAAANCRALAAVVLLPMCAWASMLATRRDLGTYVQSERAAIQAEVTLLAERLEDAA